MYLYHGKEKIWTGSVWAGQKKCQEKVERIIGIETQHISLLLTSHSAFRTEKPPPTHPSSPETGPVLGKSLDHTPSQTENQSKLTIKQALEQQPL